VLFLNRPKPGQSNRTRRLILSGAEWLLEVSTT